MSVPPDMAITGTTLYADNYVDLGLLAEAQDEVGAAYDWFTRALEELEQARREIPIALHDGTVEAHDHQIGLEPA